MSETKKKAAKQRKAMRKTGGCPPLCDLTTLEETVIGIIGNAPIDGISVGIDMGEDGEESSLCEIKNPGPSHEVDLMFIFCRRFNFTSVLYKSSKK